MHVIGTAGHVDHGKSTLIHALTSIDPDRLREEKERGMTIDLGFAWLQLPSGEEIGIVDVPGHERFIKNMLAGVGGIDLALLIIAADEGVMPQTREHLDILDLLRVSRGIVVITKSDLVEPDFLELVREEVSETLAPTTLGGAPVIAVSSQTGDGLPELIALLDSQLQETPQRPDRGRARLPIDRAFAISGFGTVVTGTLIDGSISVGSELEIVPGRRNVRVRGVQSHRKAETTVERGSRTAVNLTGVDVDEVSRGQILTTRGWLRTTGAADGHVRMATNAPGPLRHNMQITVHWLAAESLARVRLLDADRLHPGDSGWCQIVLETPLPMVKGDLFILRSNVGTLGGGEIVETDARRHRRNDPNLIARLEALSAPDPMDVLILTLDSAGPLSVSELARRTALSEQDAREHVEQLTGDGRVVRVGDGANASLFSQGEWSNLKSAASAQLATYHKSFPLRAGASREELRSRLRAQPENFPELLTLMESESVLIDEGTTVRTPHHSPTLSESQRTTASAYVAKLRGNPNNPPTGLDLDPELLGFLSDAGEVIAIGEGIVYDAEAYRRIVDEVLQHIKTNGQITVSETRDLLGSSRKYVLPLLQSMDVRRITRRVGDDRVLA